MIKEIYFMNNVEDPFFVEALGSCPCCPFLDPLGLCNTQKVSTLTSTRIRLDLEMGCTWILCYREVRTPYCTE